MSEFFIRRPIVAMVISIFTILLGFLTLRGIPIAQYPEITPPMIKITGTYNGANAVNVEQTTATPIKQQVNGVENMLYMMSINANDGTTTINSVSSTTSQRKKRRRRILDKKREERTEEEEEKFRASEAIDRILLRLSKKNVLGKGSATKS